MKFYDVIIYNIKIIKKISDNIIIELYIYKN